MHERPPRGGEPGSRRPDASACSRPPVPGALTAQAVLALQRSVGNAGLASRLARQPSATMPPSSDEATAGADGLRFLSEEGRGRLRMETGPSIALAYDTFNQACAAHAAALHAAASADADMLALVIAVFAGPSCRPWPSGPGRRGTRSPPAWIPTPRRSRS